MLRNLMPFFLIAIGGWISLANWLGSLDSRRNYSAVPVIGGLFLAAGLKTSGVILLRECWWLAFFMDFGSVPGVLYFIFRRFKIGVEARLAQKDKPSGRE